MVRKAVFWSFLGQFSTLLVTFGGSIVIARLLSPKEMGVYAVALSIVGILQIFTAFGVGAYVIREKELSPETVDAAFTINLILSILLSLILYGSSFLGAYFLDEPAVSRVLQILALLPILSAFSFRPSVMLQRGLLFRGASIIGTLGAVITTMVTIVAALLGSSYLSPAFGSVASGLFSTVALAAIGRDHLSLRLSLTGWREMSAFGLRLMSIGGISTAAVRLSDIVLAHFLGLAALGLYSRATNLTNLLFQNVYGTATRVVFAQLSEAQRDGDRVSAVFLRGFRLIVGVMGPIVIGLAILSRPAIFLMYGEQWMGAAFPLALLLIAQFISLSFAMNWELFVVRDRLKEQTRLEIARSVLGVVTNFIGAMFSLTVVAATSIVDNILSLLMYGRYMPGLAATSGRHMASLYLEACALTVAATLPCLILMLATGWDAHTPVLWIVACVALGGLGWLGLISRWNHPLGAELLRIVARLRLKATGLQPLG